MKEEGGANEEDAVGRGSEKRGSRIRDLNKKVAHMVYEKGSLERGSKW
jgi:hypothetical protein